MKVKQDYPMIKRKQREIIVIQTKLYLLEKNKIRFQASIFNFVVKI